MGMLICNEKKMVEIHGEMTGKSRENVYRVQRTKAFAIHVFNTLFVLKDLTWLKRTV